MNIKKIKESFEYQLNNYVGMTTYRALGRATAGMKLNRTQLNKLYNMFVDKEDYLKEEKFEMVGQLVKWSNSEIN